MSSQDDSHATPAEALAAILARIAAARKSAVAPAPSTTLIAVSKTHGEERIRPLLEAGQRVFGENRVQEAKAKWPALKADYADVELHLIGPLQSNKTARGGCAVRLHPFARPAQACPCAGRRNGKDRQTRSALHPGQHRRRSAEGWDRARRCGGLCRVVPRRIEIAGRRVDVHPAGRRESGAAFCAAGQARASRTPCPVSAWA